MNRDNLPVVELEEAVRCAYRNCQKVLPEGKAGRGLPDGGTKNKYDGQYFCSHQCLLQETFEGGKDKATRYNFGIPIEVVELRYKLQPVEQSA